MVSDINKSAIKKLLISFLIGTVLYFVTIKTVHFIGSPGEYSLKEEISFSILMGIVITCTSHWKTIKDIFSKKKLNDERKL